MVSYLPLAISANVMTAITIYLLTKGNIRAGAYMGFFGQCMWLTYIYLTSAWGFLPGDIFIFGMYLKKIYKYRQEICKNKIIVGTTGA
tara:strand:+ start:2747 stop:3010 length:264 start_codon:yes stop_codon:yes gene_type:complete